MRDVLAGDGSERTILMDLSIIDVMLSGWNARDGERLRDIVAEALDQAIEFCDPPHDISGHAAFIAMVEAFWRDNGECRVRRTSAIDAHHDRARYSWAIEWPNGRRFDGFDVVTLDRESGKVLRVDGFFGALQPA